MIDARLAADAATVPVGLRGARRAPPDKVDAVAASLPAGTKALVYCAWGFEIGGDCAAKLRERGIDAVAVAGGIGTWRADGLPTEPLKEGEPEMKWVTRERPKIDRIACPWLIQRFIEKQPEFLYVPADKVLSTAKETGAIPYDIPGVKFSHVGEKCSFDAFIAEYKLDAPGLDKLADIVRGADTSRLDLTPQSAGLFAISLGLSHVYQDDHEMLKHGMVMYDALYAWCRSLTGETHNWPPKMG